MSVERDLRVHDGQPAEGLAARPSRAEIHALERNPSSAHWPLPGSLRDHPVASTSKRLRPATIEEWWASETELDRRKRLLGIFDSLRRPADDQQLRPVSESESRRAQYARELWTQCGGDVNRDATWQRFVSYALQKERELFQLFSSIDRNDDAVIDRAELRAAVEREGIELPTGALEELFLSVDRDRDGRIGFEELRDSLLLLPRKTGIAEMIRYQQCRQPASRLLTVTSEGDVTPDKPDRKSSPKGKERAVEPDDSPSKDAESEPSMFEGAGKFLLAGGVAGAVSRTATAPFDRLKIYLITNADASSTSTKSDLASPSKAVKQVAKMSSSGMGVLKSAVQDLYRHGGLRAFWIGNGLNVVKIMPESAIKFLTYEASKRAFARYYDHVDSASDISNASRFMSGGLGGIVSQASIYWIETLKTQVMSTAGTKDAKVGMQLTLSTASRMWQSDGIRSFHRGLTWAVVGVFPYSGIDMALYELFKRKYIRFHDGDDLGVLASLTFGAASGGIGATCVYPLCAQGTPSHPQRYNGIRDVVAQTYSREGVRGFYRGLSVNLAKVLPSMAISWACYEAAKTVLKVEE